MNTMIKSEPNHTSWGWLIWKIIIWIIVWWLISVLLFIILSFVWNIFTWWMWQTSELTRSNPVLPLILLLIWFLSSFIGNIAIAWIYWLFFWDKYTDISKTIWLILLTNAILFIILTPIYIIFNWSLDTLFIILWLHIMFSVFLSSTQTEIVSNPNYSWSSLLWNTLWFSLAILIYLLIRKTTVFDWLTQQTYLMILMPPIVWFTVIPLWLWIWEIIYFKMYELGNNWFYTSSNETQDTKEIKNETQLNDDINIDLN